MSELWTAEQRQWLQAMGHTVWSVASAESLAAEHSPPSHEEPVASGPRGAMREAAALLGRSARPSPAQSSARPAPARASGGDRLMQSLIRAAGGIDEARVIEIAGDIAALRGNAAAKRALWPRLRALRAGSRG